MTARAGAFPSVRDGGAWEGGSELKITPVVKEGPQFARESVNRMVTGTADTFQRLVYDEQDLLVSLTNTLKSHDHDVQKSRTLIGRIVDIFATPIDPDHIEIDGMRLCQVFDAAEKERPEGVIPGGTYLVDVYSLRHMVSKAQHKTLRRGSTQQ